MGKENNGKWATVKECSKACTGCVYYDRLFHKCNLPRFQSTTAIAVLLWRITNVKYLVVRHTADKYIGGYVNI